MEAALIEPNALKDNASPEAVVPHPEPTPRLVSAAIPESSAPLHFANTRTHPQTTKVNKKPLPSLRHGFQQEIKGSKPDINDLKHVKEPSINHLLQPVKGPAFETPPGRQTIPAKPGASDLHTQGSGCTITNTTTAHKRIDNDWDESASPHSSSR